MRNYLYLTFLMLGVGLMADALRILIVHAWEAHGAARRNREDRARAKALFKQKILDIAGRIRQERAMRRVIREATEKKE